MTAEIEAAFAAQAAPGLAVAGAGLEVAVGRLAAVLEAQRAAEQAAMNDIWVAGIPAHAMPLTAGAGTLDVPNELGPRDGLAWAVHWVTAAGFTTGSVSLYLGTPDAVAQSNLRFVFTVAGVWEPPRTSTILLPGDRMVLTGTGITGNVVVTGQVTQMALRALPGFLI